MRAESYSTAWARSQSRSSGSYDAQEPDLGAQFIEESTPS
jgi:hypothetical protein